MAERTSEAISLAYSFEEMHSSQSYVFIEALDGLVRQISSFSIDCTVTMMTIIRTLLGRHAAPCPAPYTRHHATARIPGLIRHP